MIVGIFLSKKNFIKRLRDESVAYVDFRFTDPRGIWHHMTFHTKAVTESLLEEGIMFDGSSIAGWRGIENSDMILMPDLATVVPDLFAAYTTLIVTCDVYDPATGQGYNRDPRSLAKRAAAHLKKTGIADEAYFGPEPEYFVFDEVTYEMGNHHSFYYLGSQELSRDSHILFSKDRNQPHTQRAHFIEPGAGYCPVGPQDLSQDLRAQTLNHLDKMGVKVLKHHHEVASCQHELGFEYDSLLNMADILQLFKYTVRNTAYAAGKTATFMPKPVAGENGSGMHVHQSLWKAGKPLFAGDQYDGLSQTALHYMGGILFHAKALNAFTNPSTNSYKRLVPGYEAPVYLSYSASNRSVAIRIPYSQGEKAKRIEVRFPDPLANPYLALPAMMMAGLDGIANKIDPGEAVDKNLYEADTSGLKNMATSLEEALHHLDKDRDFLTQGGVFDHDQLDGYIVLKKEEIEKNNMTPTPQEFKMYYGL